MSKRSSSRASKTDWPRVRAMRDSDIDLTEIPEMTAKDFARAILRVGLKPAPPKAAISLRLDADVLEWLKAQGPGYQTRINAILRAVKDVAGTPATAPAPAKQRRAA